MRCEICDKEATERHCELHQKAYEEVVERYNEWKRALDISWKEYLNEAAKNPYTGSWAKEVAEQLMKSGDR